LIRHKQIPETILEQRLPTPQEAAFCEQFSIAWIVQTPDHIEQFWLEHEQVVVSPGIDSRPWAHRFPKKVLSELDIFADAFEKRSARVPVIAITGTLGKTTITYLTGKLAQSLGKNVFVGGNIGIGMLDAVDDPSIDLFVLEISSFQLEYTTRFRPAIAVVTNIFENHLDRHGSFAEYRAIKCKIFAHQKSSDCAIIPESLRPFCSPLVRVLTIGDSPRADYYIQNHAIVREGSVVVQIDELPPQSYPINWAYLIAIGAQMGLAPSKVCETLRMITLPEHRCVPIARINGVTYFDDSKSTVIEATRAAVESLSSRTIILLLGGVSKGVDRTRALAFFPRNGLKIIPFGGEAALLFAGCREHALTVETACSTLEQAVDRAYQIAEPGDCVLLSPGGASFDLFGNYMLRGKRFKEILDRLQHQ
jgi:UDP-N-acetylmuramoylalanine--D-glutamate ligase